MISTRADIITRRTYNRPKDKEGKIFETWEETVGRVIGHQQWLWERALNKPLNEVQLQELDELEVLMLERKSSCSGRTLWLGGTDISRAREASQFNCSFTEVETIYDMVDVLWLLLQGCGVGFKPVVGTLTGFRKPIRVLEVIRSHRIGKGGLDYNVETWDEKTKIWTIKVGDSAEAWAKSIGKLVAGKYPARKLVLDFSELRPAGMRLAGYGWISSGDSAIARAYSKIFNILNSRADMLLTKINIMDIVNWLGTILSSRRSAEIALFSYGTPEWREFAVAKKDWFLHDNKHRTQSNNSLVFYRKPSREELAHIFTLMKEAGGSEPGFINAQAALNRAPWYKGVNPSLRKGTRVYTNMGILPIENLENDFFEVYTLNNANKEAGCRLSGTNKQLYKITLEGNHTYYATKEHNWPIYRKISRDKWCTNPIKVTTQELLPGDCLVNILRNSLYPNAKKGSYSDGFFIGWLLGDGWITIRGDNNKTQIGLILSDYDYKSKIRVIIENKLKELNSEATFHKSSNDAKSWELNTQNQNITNWLISFGVTDKNSLPTSIFSSEYSEEFRKGFIDASFSSDGYVEKTCSSLGIRLGISSNKESRIKDLKELLGFYGIKTSELHTETTGTIFPNGKTYEKIYKSTSLRISSSESLKHFSTLFTLSHELKQSKIEEAIEKTVKTKLLGKIRIDNIEKTELFEDVYDIGVYDDSHTFQLAHGFTGNCVEVLLGNKSFCNLFETDIGKFRGNNAALHRAVYVVARANYRQTCVNLNDGILQEAWHLNNEFLRLCGVGLTGIAKRPDLGGYDYKYLQRMATYGAYSMADELGTPRPKNVTLIKPSGTLSKIMDTTEGGHKPLGRYIFNNVQFGKHDPLIDILKEAKYNVFNHPTEDESVLVTLPVCYDDVEFETVDGIEVNLETAVEQLERYKLLQNNWADQNVSVTISYDLHEVSDIIDWLLANWEYYVGVSFIYRNDPTKTAKDLGYLFLPQEVVSKEKYDEYVTTLLPIDLDAGNSLDELQSDECEMGVCPVK